MGQPSFALVFGHEVQVNDIERKPAHDVLELGLDRIDQVRRASSHQEVNVRIGPETTRLERADHKASMPRARKCSSASEAARLAAITLAFNWSRRKDSIRLMVRYGNCV
jgi:hypothetical protein